MQGHIELPQSINHPFDLAKTLDGSQDFRWQSLDDGWHSGVLKGNLVHLRQNVGALEYRAHTNLDALLTSYFRLDEDMDAVYSTLSSLDPYIATLANEYPHLRLLRQPDPWECTVAYLCSANNNVPRIRNIVEGIAQKLGKRLELNGDIRYTFPTPEAVLQADPESLQAMRLGLDRHNKIVEAARHVRSRELDLQRLARPDTPYSEAKRQLMDCPYIGDKIADCIALFALDKLQAFPVDTHVKKAATRHFFASQPPPTDRHLVTWAQDYFGVNAGYANQLLFQSQWGAVAPINSDQHKSGATLSPCAPTPLPRRPNHCLIPILCNSAFK